MAQSNIHLAQAIANTQPNNGSGMDINALATAIATAIVAAQNANKTVEQVKDEAASAPKEYLCSGCSQPFDSPQGKSIHERKHCKVLNPEVTETE